MLYVIFHKCGVSIGKGAIYNVHVHVNGLGHITKMAAMLIIKTVKDLLQIQKSDEYSIGYSSSAKNIEMMTLV